MGCWKTRIQSATLTLTCALPFDLFERLVCDDRFRGGIFSRHHLASTQKISQACLSRGSLRVSENPVWAVISSEGVHQVCGSGVVSVEKQRHQDFFIHALTAAGDHRFSYGNKSPQTPRIHNKLGKESVGAVTYTEYLRLSINSLSYCVMLSKEREPTFHFSAWECGDVQAVSSD